MERSSPVMVASRGISGVGVAMAGAGGLLAYAAFTDKSIPDALRSVMKGDITTVKGGTTAATSAGSAGSAGSGAVFESSSNIGVVFDSSRDTAGSALGSAAAKYKGRPYAWGFAFTDGVMGGGGDCSGLLYRAFHDLGYNTPRLTSGGYLVWKAVRKATSPVPGDILWYPGHVAIAWSSGQMIEAPTWGIPVRVTKIRPGATALRPDPGILNEYRRDARRGT